MNGTTLKDEDWRAVYGLFDAFQLLRTHGLLSVEMWRRMHCVCCREIWDRITDPRSRTAVETAERFLEKSASLQDLQEAFVNAKCAEDETWGKVMSLRIPADSNIFKWPISKVVDEAWIRYLAASAATTCAKIDKEAVLFTRVPDAACSIRAWREARPDVVGGNHEVEIVDEPLREAVLQRWDEIWHEEERRLVRRLRELVESQP